MNSKCIAIKLDGSQCARYKSKYNHYCNSHQSDKFNKNIYTIYFYEFIFAILLSVVYFYSMHVLIHN